MVTLCLSYTKYYVTQSQACMDINILDVPVKQDRKSTWHGTFYWLFDGLNFLPLESDL